MSGNTGDNADSDQLCGGGGGGSNSEEVTSSKKDCTSCDHNVESVTAAFNSVAMLDNKSTCASCGKEGNSDEMNTCNKCKMVKYCNAACKKKHRSKHKKACERRAAELHDEKLFKEVEPEECPLCMQPIPIDTCKLTFQTCCGKLICNGCIYTMKMSEGKGLCAFCRTPDATSGEELIKRVKKLMKNGNANAFNMFGSRHNMPQDWAKANELWLKAGELGCADGYYNLGISYHWGKGVEVDIKKAKHYYELAVMGGSVKTRYNLGCLDWNTGDYFRAIRHWMIAAKSGDEESLDRVKRGFMEGDVTNDEYANTLRAHHERQKEMKSDARDKAVASDMFDYDIYAQHLHN